MSEACISVFGKAYSVLWLKKVFSFVHNDLHHHIAPGNACMLPCRRRCYEKSTGWRSSNNHYLFCVCRPQEQDVKPHFHGHVRFCKKRLLYIWPVNSCEVWTIDNKWLHCIQQQMSTYWEMGTKNHLKNKITFKHEIRIWPTGFYHMGEFELWEEIVGRI